jgi:hypothetical protein
MLFSLASFFGGGVDLPPHFRKIRGIITPDYFVVEENDLFYMLYRERIRKKDHFGNEYAKKVTICKMLVHKNSLAGAKYKRTGGA